PNPAWQHPLWGRLRYARSWLALVDLLAILPFFVGLFAIQGDGRILRSVRLIRLLKLTRYSHSLELLFTVLRQEVEHLVSALFILCLFILLCAAGIHLVEGDVQPNAFGSIPRALWWAVVTVASVGYGDVVPVTTLGKLFSSIMIIGGITIAALPAAILASGIMSELARRREQFRTELLKLLQTGKLDFAELRHLEKLRLQIGVSRADAKLVFEEAKQAQRLLEKPVQCPHCRKVFFTEKHQASGK
ncbi:MAG: ion transporter, partial [Thiothrix sp.]